MLAHHEDVEIFYMKWLSNTAKTIGLRNKVGIFMLACMTTSMGFSQGSQGSLDYRSIPASDYWKQSEVPLLGQLVPVNQINLQKGVHLFDVETIGKQWQGLTNPFDTMGLGSYDTTNQETLIRLRYAYPLARYTYIGVTAGFATR